MLRWIARHGLVHGAHLPGVRRLPVVKLVAVGEIALLARSHLMKLDAGERRRLIALVRTARGRPASLAPEEREELARLVAKAEPRLFAGLVADRLSPVPLPRRIVRGPRRRR